MYFLVSILTNLRVKEQKNGFSKYKILNIYGYSNRKEVFFCQSLKKWYYRLATTSQNAAFSIQQTKYEPHKTIMETPK
jgi:hypothetical protein